tara:strand:+ start:83 stop:715 length:633 start_codon:yes stop_codon:yes gene_type:complete
MFDNQGLEAQKQDIIHIDDEVFADIAGNNIKWTPEERIMAATYYSVTGSSLQAAERCKQAGSDIPASTIRKWKNQSAWWKPVLHEVRKAKQEELDAKLTNIIMEGTDQLADRIINGNHKLNSRTGDVERVPMSSNELSRDAIGIPFDKRALMRGDATSRVEKIDPQEMLKGLADQFIKIVHMNEPKVINAKEEIEDSEEQGNEPTYKIVP